MKRLSTNFNLAIFVLFLLRLWLPSTEALPISATKKLKKLDRFEEVGDRTPVKTFTSSMFEHWTPEKSLTKDTGIKYNTTLFSVFVNLKAFFTCLITASSWNYQGNTKLFVFP
jgi:hypothetical protein